MTRTRETDRITVHGREDIVVVSGEESLRVNGQPTGEVLVKVLQNSPLCNIKIERRRTRGRVRAVEG